MSPEPARFTIVQYFVVSRTVLRTARLSRAAVRRMCESAPQPKECVCLPCEIGDIVKAESATVASLSLFATFHIWEGTPRLQRHTVVQYSTGLVRVA